MILRVPERGSVHLDSAFSRDRKDDGVGLVPAPVTKIMFACLPNDGQQQPRQLQPARLDRGEKWRGTGGGAHDSRPSIRLPLLGTGERSRVAVPQKGADGRFMEHVDQVAGQEFIHR